MPHHYLISADSERLKIFVATPGQPPAGAMQRVSSIALQEGRPDETEWESLARADRQAVGCQSREIAGLIGRFLTEQPGCTWDFIADFELYALVLAFVDVADKRRLIRATVRSPIGRTSIDRQDVVLSATAR